MDVRRVHLHAAPCLRTVILDVCSTNVTSIELPAQVVHLTVDCRRSSWTSPPVMNITGMDAVQRLTLQLNGDTSSILKYITKKRGAMKIDLCLDLYNIAPAKMDCVAKMICVLGSIAMFGKADMLQKLQLTYSDKPSYVDFAGRLPSVLSVCRDLLSLRLEVPYAIGLCDILSSVGRDLVHLAEFILCVKESTAIIDATMVAPCTLFTTGALRGVSLDFCGIDLTDEAVAFMVDVAVRRSTCNHRNQTTLKVEGSSVGARALDALSTSTALLGCKFSFYNYRLDHLTTYIVCRANTAVCTSNLRQLHFRESQPSCNKMCLLLCSTNTAVCTSNSDRCIFGNHNVELRETGF